MIVETFHQVGRRNEGVLIDRKFWAHPSGGRRHLRLRRPCLRWNSLMSERSLPLTTVPVVEIGLDLVVFLLIVLTIGGALKPRLTRI